MSKAQLVITAVVLEGRSSRHVAVARTPRRRSQDTATHVLHG